MPEIELDHDGIAAVLKSPEMAAAIHAKAEEVAGNARATHDTDIVVDDYTTDRAASSVTIRDSRAALWQATEGVLTRSAAAAGLEVTER